MRLFSVELRRACARRLTLVFLLLAIVGIIVAALTTFAHAGQLSHEAGSYVFDPATGRGTFVPRTGPRNGFDLRTLMAVWQGTTVPFSLLGMILGASLIGAEWRSNTVGLVLTWEARRSRVFASKLAAAVVVTVAGFFVLQALVGVSLLPVAITRGTTSGLDAAWWRGSLGVIGRGAINCMVLTTLGFSIAMMARNAAAAIGSVFAYAFILEGALGGRFHWLREWLLIPNASTFVQGNPSEGILQNHSTLVAGLTILAYAVVLASASMAVFRSRDVL
jgi:ABC-type transport system involved in multi-copper enzyme maturation permease subunit